MRETPVNNEELRDPNLQKETKEKLYLDSSRKRGSVQLTPDRRRSGVPGAKKKSKELSNSYQITKLLMEGTIPDVQFPRKYQKKNKTITYPCFDFCPTTKPDVRLCMHCMPIFSV